jgi:hypothetical protein
VARDVQTTNFLLEISCLMRHISLTPVFHVHETSPLVPIPIQTNPVHTKPTLFVLRSTCILSFHLHPGLDNCLFPLCFLSSILYALLVSPLYVKQGRSSVVGWPGRSMVRSPMMSSDFSTDLIHPHTGPGVDSASNRNEYQESSWG